jgi:hypothetical protein
MSDCSKNGRKSKKKRNQKTPVTKVSTSERISSTKGNMRNSKSSQWQSGMHSLLVIPNKRTSNKKRKRLKRKLIKR